MKNPHNIEVGQSLFFSRTINRGHRGRDDFWVKVSRIGRVWAYAGDSLSQTDRYKISLETLAVDGGEYGSPGQCYTTEKERRDGVEAAAISRMIRDNLDWAPKHTDLDALKTAADALGLVY